MKLCTFNITWEIEDNGTLDDHVLYRSDMVLDASFNPGLRSSVGIKLRQVASAQSPCLLSVDVDAAANVIIDAVDVVCNARHIEIFSRTGEYVATTDGTRVDDELGCQQIVYMLPCSFQPSVSHCTLKFVSLEAPHELWIHSIHVTISRAADVSSSAMSKMLSDRFAGLGIGQQIDMDQVKAIMYDMNGLNMNPQARDLMERIQNKQKELKTAAGAAQNFSFPISSAMMSMFSNMCFDQSPNVSSIRPEELERHDVELQDHSIDLDLGSTAARVTVTNSESCSVDRGLSQYSCHACGGLLSNNNTAQLQEQLLQFVSAVEQRMTSRFLLELDRIETKMDRRFDEILRCLSGHRVDAVVDYLD